MELLNDEDLFVLDKGTVGNGVEVASETAPNKQRSRSPSPEGNFDASKVLTSTVIIEEQKRNEG